MQAFIKNKVCERTSAPQPLNLEGSEPDFARRRTAAQLPSFVRRVHPPEGFVSQEIDEIYCERTKSASGLQLPSPSILRGANRTLRAAARQRSCLPLCGVCIPRRVYVTGNDRNFHKKQKSIQSNVCSLPGPSEPYYE